MELLIYDLLLMAVAALIGGYIAFRLRIPLAIGYVAAGGAIGPHTAGPTIAQLPVVVHLSEVGLALLLFSLGLQFAEKSIKLAAPTIWLAPLLQLGIAVFASLTLYPVLGHNGWLAILFSLSSVIVLKDLSPRLQRTDRVAEQLATSILTAQSYAIIPIFLLLQVAYGVIATPSSQILALTDGLLLLAGFALLRIVVVPYLPRLLHPFDVETKTLIALACVVLISIGAFTLGVPFLIMAFALGTTIGSAKLLRPSFRPLLSLSDLFGVLFFLSLGVLLDLPLVVANLPAILVSSCAIMAGKWVIFSLLLRTLGTPATTSYLAAASLTSVSELSIVLAQFGGTLGIFNPTTYGVTVTIILVTLLLTPLLFIIALPLLALLQRCRLLR
jgi:monovalent cation:H+ antiporter-2, CPA2 family